MADDIETVESPEKKVVKRVKKLRTESEPGIVYFSRIPPYMSVKKVRQIFTHHGEIGRIFLQPDGNYPIIAHAMLVVI